MSDSEVTTAASVSTLGLHTLGTRVAVHALGFVASVLIARALGPEGRGRYYLPVTLITLVYTVINVGTVHAQMRLRAGKRTSFNDLMGTGVVLSVVLGAAGAGLLWAILTLGDEWLNHEVAPTTVLFLLPIVPLMLHSVLLSSLLNVGGLLSRANVALLLGAVAQTVATAAWYFLGTLNVTLVLAFFGLSILVPWMGMFRAAIRSWGAPRWPSSAQLVKDQVSLGLRIWPYVVFEYLILRADVVLLSILGGVYSVGIYSVAVIFAELIWLAPDALTHAVVHRQANMPLDEVSRVTLAAVRMNLLMASVLGIIVALAGSILIAIAYGPAFSEAAEVLLLLIPGAIGMGMWRPLGFALVLVGAAWAQPVTTLVALLVNLTANAFLIPRLGASGAAIASTTSYLVGALLAALFFRRGTGMRLELIPRRAELARISELLRPVLRRINA